jgi:probable 2-oxoglutarate dehydrogenase E1 component DHKTD1
VEFSHVVDPEERQWLHDHFEQYMNDKSGAGKVADKERVKALHLLLRAEEMELFIHKKFATHKRYSGEGSESLIVALNALISEASKADAQNGDDGIEHVVLGMPHRGRMATLVVLNDYPMKNLLHKIAGNSEISDEVGDRVDDIPTHIAVSNSKKFSSETGSAKS